MGAHNARDAGHEEEYQYYPSEWFEPLLARRRALGKDLYTRAKVPKGDVIAMKNQEGRNYEFFGAPVGLFFTMDKRNGIGAYVDMGGFLQSVMIAARVYGLHSCPQQSFSKYHLIVKEQLSIPAEQLLVCGMSMGFADRMAEVNKVVAKRAPLEAFATFHWE